MKIGEFVKSKKFKNICVTLVEILVIAGVIMGILMTVQNKLKSGNRTGIHIGNADSEEEKKEEKEEVIDEYYIEVNIKKNAVIIYQYNKDKTAKNPIKVMNASIGKKVKADKYKLKESYTWRNGSDGIWNKYNVRFSESGWISSADYSDKYSWTLTSDSYEKIGSRQSDDTNIRLYAGDASWIFKNCAEGTVVKIVKGKDTDTLPLEISEKIALQKKCGWDPTDSVKGNPYKNAATGTVSAYSGTVLVEKGTEADYLANVIALNEKGDNITGKLKYDKIDTSKMGKQTVKYTYTTKKGTSLEAEVKYKVVDTMVPVVTLSKEKYTYEVDSGSTNDVNKKSVKEAIEELVKKGASASEGTIQVTALPKEQLVVGMNYVRVVATDEAGNVGSAQAIVEIKVKEKKLNEKYNPDKKLKQKSLKAAEEKTTKSSEKTTKKKEEKTTKASEKETTMREETTTGEEENTEQS